MSKVKTVDVAWEASPSPDVVGYVFRWTPAPGPINYDPEINPGEDMGMALTKELPTPTMSTFDGSMLIGITAKDEAGNESDPEEQTFPFDFVPPAKPTNLHIVVLS